MQIQRQTHQAAPSLETIQVIKSLKTIQVLICTHLAANTLLASENSGSFVMWKLSAALKCRLSANLSVSRLPNE